MTSTPVPLPLPDPPLHDDEVSLRAWVDADAAVLAAAWRDPAVARWTGAPEHASEEAARRWIAGEADRRGRGLALDLTVVVGGVPVGEVGLARFDRPRRVAELGWWTAPERRGRGYATRATRLLTGWALTELCLDKVYARVDPRNEPSIGVARSAGLDRRGLASDGLEVWASDLHRVEWATSAAIVRS